MSKKTNSQHPAAWMYDFSADHGEVKNWVTTDRAEASHPENHNVRPLYTHPAPAPAELDEAQLRAMFRKARIKRLKDQK